MSKGVETFDTKQFQMALPEGYVSLGIVSSEYCYLIPVTQKAGILVRSSINTTGLSGGLGEDSIRIYPAKIRQIPSILGPVWSYELFGSSDARWVTRMAGWQKRLQDSIQKLSALIDAAGECPVCGKAEKILKVKKEGTNKGRWFAVCPEKSHFHDSYIWLD